METSNTPSTLAQKEALLTQAEAMVAELRQQIQTLRSAAQPSKFETLLAGQALIAPTTKQAANFTAAVTVSEAAMKTVDEKNEKGVVSKTILQVLADGKPKSVDQAMNEVNQLLDKPTTKGSMRGTLANLKNANLVIKTAYGEYAIQPQKGESPTSTNGEAFNLQPSPTKGANTENLA